LFRVILLCRILHTAGVRFYVDHQRRLGKYHIKPLFFGKVGDLAPIVSVGFSLGIIFAILSDRLVRLHFGNANLTV